VNSAKVQSTRKTLNHLYCLKKHESLLVILIKFQTRKIKRVTNIKLSIEAVLRKSPEVKIYFSAVLNLRITRVIGIGLARAKAVPILICLFSATDRKAYETWCSNVILVPVLHTELVKTVKNRINRDTILIAVVLVSSDGSALYSNQLCLHDFRLEFRMQYLPIDERLY
jgi:hypothetical protein